MKLTHREIACLIWNAMYPDRRKFNELEEGTKAEWERYAELADAAFKLNSFSEENLKTVKKAIKL